jgi:hypothetical protein
MAQLINQTNYFGSHNKTYLLEITWETKALNPQLLTCYYFCDNKNIQITDIIFEFTNHNTGYNVPWQRCVRYGVDDFRRTYQNVTSLLSKYDHEDFTGWCVIFKRDGVEYSLIGAKNSDEVLLNCSHEINKEIDNLFDWLEEKINTENKGNNNE